jgi:hypothetical protein
VLRIGNYLTPFLKELNYFNADSDLSLYFHYFDGNPDTVATVLKLGQDYN